MVADLRHLSRLPPVRIESDRPCVNCGYNLLGLMTDGACPECNFPITSPKKNLPRYSDQMSHAPIGWLRRFALGGHLLAFGQTTAVVAVVLRLGTPPVIWSLLLVLASILWTLGAFIATTPRPVTKATTVDPIKEWAIARTVTRMTQPAWFVAASAAMLTVNGALPVGAGAIILASAMLVGSIGVVFLAAYLSNVAHWASDAGLSHSLRSFVFILVTGGLVGLLLIVAYIVLKGAGGSAQPILLMLGTLLLLIPFVYLLICCWRLASVAAWAIRARHATAQRDERLGKPNARPACENCGYDLTGLPPTTPCPECGHASEAVPAAPDVRPPEPDLSEIPLHDGDEDA